MGRVGTWVAIEPADDFLRQNLVRNVQVEWLDYEYWIYKYPARASYMSVLAII